ncbi:MAG: ABC transporter permease subunit [Rhodospirillales bacterium]|nr:ABC transporter permease subunit [Rhodospirillales bacterium]MDH3917251.1 ABC transporter permease subunit [Rhodospirillales bacterium]MDH3967237.1 ABC transporter permease subunit [Rhodospirillales bacterium]
MALSRIFGNGQETKDPYGAPGTGKSTLISVVTIVVILGTWWLVTELELIRALFVPPPGLVFSKFLKISCYDHYMETLLVFIGARDEVVAECLGFSENALHQHILWSLYRVFSSFFLALVTAIPIGIAMGVNRFARGVFDPPIEFYRPIPPLAYLPLTIIWFGIGDFAKIILIYLACFAPLAISARAGVRSCSIEQIHAAYSMGASRHQVMWHVVLKAALPEILTGMRISIAFGWTTLVAAEMVAAKAGIGVMVLNAARFLATDIVFLGIVVIGLIAFFFDVLMRRMERLLVPWKGKA